jgi:hypothetical protein
MSICYNDGPPHPRVDCDVDRCGLDPLHDCGYPVDSFACKIRHLQINTGAAKAAKD